MDVSPQEQALAATALFRGLQADAPISFSVHDELLRYECVSQSLAATHGLTAEDHHGRLPSDMLSATIAPRIEALLADVRDTRQARIGIEFDGEHASRPGEIRTWVAGVYPIQLGQRWLTGVVLVDVTDRRRAQDALRASETELSGAQRMAGVGWWTWTAEPEAMTYAPELLALLGRDPALGDTPHAEDQLVMADEHEQRSVRESALAALAGVRPFARRVRARHADGRPRLLEARADVVHDAAGKPVGLQGFAQDITELARAEQRQRVVAELGQRALEERDLDALLQHAVDLVGREVGVDGVGALEILPGGERAAIRALAGRPSTEAPGTIPIEPGGVVDRALTRRGSVVAADLLTDPELEISELELRGGTRSAAVVVIDGRTGPFGVLGAMSEQPDQFTEEDAVFLASIANVLSDAVERRAADAEIAEISAARGRLVAQAIDAEDRARRSISEALHDGALQELLAVRNELYAMAGQGGDDQALAATQERLTAIVARLRDVMSALHPTMLQYGGLEAALLAVVEQERGAGEFEAHVVVDPAAAGARDELLLSLARELLANASRHAAASRVDVGVHLQGEEIVLRVADDGAGYARGRLAQALAAGAIGLASCRERVEAVGGRLEVHSAPGAGTHATARIPRHRQTLDEGEAGIPRLDEGKDRA